MTQDAHPILEQIIAYCNDKWVEADKALPTPYETPDMKTGSKIAYNNVLQYARALLAECSEG
jgi:hypothetical protein